MLMVHCPKQAANCYPVDEQGICFVVVRGCASKTQQSVCAIFQAAFARLQMSRLDSVICPIQSSVALCMWLSSSDAVQGQAL